MKETKKPTGKNIHLMYIRNTHSEDTNPQVI